MKTAWSVFKNGHFREKKNLIEGIKKRARAGLACNVSYASHDIIVAKFIQDNSVPSGIISKEILCVKSCYSLCGCELRIVVFFSGFIFGKDQYTLTGHLISQTCPTTHLRKFLIRKNHMTEM